MDALVDTLAKIISPIYMVGGSVRDELLSRQPVDYDFATPLTPEEIESRLKSAGLKAYTAGKRFGTIGAKINGQTVEITTFRRESYVMGNRNPQVEFVPDLLSDLSRRDFTINAIAKPNRDYIDPFDGREDLALKIIRTVGKAQERFTEDPLRLLRAVRLASELEFTIESDTFKAIKTNARAILLVSKERWMSELDKLVLSPQPSNGMARLADSHLLHFILPELAMQKSNFDEVWQKTLQSIDQSPVTIEERWAALFVNLAVPYLPLKESLDSARQLNVEFIIKLSKYFNWSRQRTRAILEISVEKRS